MEKKDMSKIEMHKRENIGVDEMSEYVHGGFSVETHTNGASIYVPYGIYLDLFKAINSGMNGIDNTVSELSDLIETLSSEDSSASKKLTEMYKSRIEDLKRDKHILEYFVELGHEV